MPIEIRHIEPLLARPEAGIRACFTLKNPELSATGSGPRTIPGLNLGATTEAPPEEVEYNRALLLEWMEVEPGRAAYAEQVHGTRVRAVEEGGTYPATDALVTRTPGLLLAIQVADCAAVLLSDPVNRVIGAAHAGWRGAQGGILGETVQAMERLGAEPAQTDAFISPCISGRHFEVGPEVAERFPGAYVDDTSYDKPHVNLKAFLEHRLVELGLRPGKIEVHAGCTVADAGAYYSYRREAERSGRMMGLIQLTEDV